ncbi:hypothetical protein V8E54_015276 [Elaphomyces granulatus]
MSRPEFKEKLLPTSCHTLTPNDLRGTNKRAEAREKLMGLKMAFNMDFNKFQAEFGKLAHTGGLPQQDWKQELHMRLFDRLKIQMQPYMIDDSYSFQQYCHLASGSARVMKEAAQNREKSRSRAPLLGLVITVAKKATGLEIACALGGLRTKLWAPSRKMKMSE